MSLAVVALWMLCTLGAVVFAAVPLGGWWGGAAFAAGLGGALGGCLLSGRMDLAVIGLLVLLAAVHQLFRPQAGHLSSLAAAGALAGVWGAQLVTLGLPLPVALPVVLILPVLSASLAAVRPVFVTGPIHDEGLVIVAALAVLVAAMPLVAEGWRAAAALNIGGLGPVRGVPAWAAVLGVLAAVSGGLYALWERR